MMVSFYRPGRTIQDILEKGGVPFGSIRGGFSSAASRVMIRKRRNIGADTSEGESTLRDADILDFIQRHGCSDCPDSPGKCEASDRAGLRYSGHQGSQDMLKAARWALIWLSGAGNLELKLHDWGPDFACGTAAD